MNNLIQDLPDNINITVSKQDLIEFADYLLSNQQQPVIEQDNRKKILNTQETADFIGLSKQTVYGLTHSGRIPYYKRGKKLYFKLEELEAWITEYRGFNQKEIEAKAADYIRKNPRKW